MFTFTVLSTLKYPIFNGLSCELYQEYTLYNSQLTYTLWVTEQWNFVCWTKNVEMIVNITVNRHDGIQNFKFSNSRHSRKWSWYPNILRDTWYWNVEWVSSFWLQMSRVVSWTQEDNNVFVIISCKSPLRFIKIVPVVTFIVQKY